MVNFYTYLSAYLNDYGSILSLKDFEIIFKKPHQTIKRHLSRFLDEKILILKKKGKFSFYSLNLKNPRAFEYLSICEKERLFDFLKNPLFLIFYEKLFAYFDEYCFAIFGSAADSKKFNDIDLLILGNGNNEKLKNEIRDFELEYSIKVHAIFSCEKGIRGTFIQEIKKKHIILNNHGYFSRLFSRN